MGAAGLLALKEISRSTSESEGRTWAKIRGILSRLDSLPSVESISELGPNEGYASWAESYDSPANPFFSLQDRFFFPELASIKWPPGMVLDAGGGTGRVSAVLSGQLGVVPLIVDHSLEMLEQGRTSHSELRVVRADFSRMPIADASASGVICSLALTHSGSLGQAVAEFARVLQDDGRIVICDVHPSAVSLGWQAFFRHPSGETVFLRNHLHSMSEYFSAFTEARLRVVKLSEIPFDRDSINAMEEKDVQAGTLLADAFEGLPALVVWVLERRAQR